MIVRFCAAEITNYLVKTEVFYRLIHYKPGVYMTGIKLVYGITKRKNIVRFL